MQYADLLDPYNHAYLIREAFDYWQHFDDAVPGHNGLSHSDQQGWCYKRYHHHHANSTVIISSMTHIHSVLFLQLVVTPWWGTINTCWDCWCVADVLFLLWSLQWSSSLLVWTPPLLFAGTPSPLRPALCRTYSKNWLYWCFDTPDCNSVVLLSLKKGREISFKICYSLVNVPFFFFFTKKQTKKELWGICAHVPCHLGHTCQDQYVCVWMVNGVKPGDVQSHMIKDDIAAILISLKFPKYCCLPLRSVDFLESFLKIKYFGLHSLLWCWHLFER